MSDYICIVIAPALYWVLGLPWLIGFAPQNAWRLAPLLGCALAGWIGEFCLIVKLPPSVAIWGALFASCLVLAFLRSNANGRRHELWPVLFEGLLLYSLALVPAVISPFPVIGDWSGDWLLCYQQGQAIYTGQIFSSQLLERPPLFGAATLPLWTFGAGLAPFQIMSAVASAALLGAVIYAIDYFRAGNATKNLGRIIPLAPLLVSPFFLHHTAACWSKPLAGALVLVGLIDCWDAWMSGSRSSWWRGSIWFALAVAVHQSSIIYVFFLLAIVTATAPGERSVGATFKLLTISLVCLLFIVGPYELWSIAHYGLAAKVSANPALAQRAESGVGFTENTVLCLLSSFIGWSPLLSLRRWLTSPHPLGAVTVAKESWWLLTKYLTMLASTLFGIFLPFVILATGRYRNLELNRYLKSPDFWRFGAAVAGVLIANAVLSPFWSANGSAQNGLVCLVLMIFVGLLRWGTDFRGFEGQALISRVTWMTALIGGIPLLALNLIVEFGLNLSANFRDTFAKGSEGDWTERVLKFHLQPLGVSHFPFMQLLVSAMAIALIILMCHDGIGHRTRDSS
jgi:hypothetical protein